MQAELLDIRNHIAQHAPFDEMPEELLDRIVTGIEVAYYRAGTQILELGQQNYWLHYIRSGAVEIFRRSGELYNRIGEGEIFGQ
ncbi:MAG TPA: cyclic nucleotide-binding protein, partial [Marinobacter hydrocarbonoclasticus]|nr:cyclic nucleotide-binding protein [Marinobacter nauticus]